MITTFSIRDYTEHMALRQPPPGGGSTAALSGLLGISLLELLINLTLASAGAVRVKVSLPEKKQELATLRTNLLALTEDDAAILEEVLALFQNSAVADIRSGIQAQVVLQEAARIPLTIADACLQAVTVGTQLAGVMPDHVQGDLLTAVFACQTGVHGALLSVAANLPWLADDRQTAALQERLLDVKQDTDRLVEGLQNEVYASPLYQIMR